MKNVLLVVLVLFSLPGICIAKSQSLQVLPRFVVGQNLASTGFLPSADKSTPAEIDRGGATKSKLASFATRTVSAVVVLSGLVVLVRTTGEWGIIGLILAAQIGLFSEAVHVSAVEAPSKWWALLTNMVFWDAKYFLPNDKTALINLSVFGMLILHMVALIVQQNRSAEFSQSLRSFCASHVAAAILVGMSSSWLATLQSFSARWIYYPFLLVIVNDTMAYICGQLLGKRKLLPNISPNKTWEGFIGAAIFTVALSAPIWDWIGASELRSKGQLYVFGLYASLVAPFGGFLASSVKRNFGKKDFGAIMPGHGGLVDRLDCQLLTAPFVYLFLKYLEDSP
jgi:phosphatidate cytidylyltransferase